MGDGSRGTLAIWVVAAVLGGIALVRLVGSEGDQRGSPVRVERSPDAAAASAQPGDGADRDGDAGLYVHVAGAVRRPGLVRVPADSRVAVALERAGGLQRRADLAGVNLAARLEDGQQVIVPVRGAAGVAGPGGPAAAPAGSAGAPKLSLAAATADQLDEIDGIGPTLAERILEYRTEHGGFRTLDELREVEGIGEKRFATLREALQP